MNLCPIVDIAGNVRLNRLAEAFLQVEVLAMSSGYGPFQERILKDSGLCEESPQTILEMKSVLADYRDWQSKKSNKVRSK